jgi:hypothetical protein
MPAHRGSVFAEVRHLGSPGSVLASLVRIAEVLVEVSGTFPDRRRRKMRDARRPLAETAGPRCSTECP